MASGGAVSDSFYNLGRPGAPQPFCNPVVIEDLQIGAWLLPGDSLSSVQMDIGYSPFSGDVGSRLLRPSGSTDLGTNQYGFDIQQIDFTLYMITPPFGEFWLTLSRAQSADQDPIYWDENSGWAAGTLAARLQPIQPMTIVLVRSLRKPSRWAERRQSLPAFCCLAREFLRSRAFCGAS